MDRSDERTDAPDPAATRYDSFQLRLWSRPGSGEVLRVEITHLQSGAVEVATGETVATALDLVAATLRSGERPAVE